MQEQTFVTKIGMKKRLSCYQKCFKQYDCIWTFILFVVGKPVNELEEKWPEQLLTHLHEKTV